MANRSNLPFVSSNIPPDLRQFLERVRETLDGNTYVKRTDYLYGTVPRLPGEPPGDGGGGSGGGGGGGGPLPCGNPVTPTAPTGFTVTPGFSGFLLSWDMPAYCGHDRTEVYALRRNGGASELTEANRLGESRGVMYSHVVNQADDYWCFWIRHVNTAGVRGPFNNTLGSCAKTVISPEVLIDTLTGQITESQLYKHLGERINLIDGAASVAGSVNARVQAIAQAAKVDLENLANGLTDIYIQTDQGYTTLRTLNTTVADPETGLAAAHAGIIDLSEVVATGDAAAASRISSLEAKVDTGKQTVSAYVAAQEDAWVNGDGALAQRFEGVETLAAGNARPNLCLNGNFEDGLTPMGGSKEGFVVTDNHWGRVALRGSPPNTPGMAIVFPRLAVSPGTAYTISGDAALFVNPGGSGTAYFDLIFTGANGNVVKDGTQRPKQAPFDFSDDPARRNELAATDTAAATGSSTFRPTHDLRSLPSETPRRNYRLPRHGRGRRRADGDRCRPADVRER